MFERIWEGFGSLERFLGRLKGPFFLGLTWNGLLDPLRQGFGRVFGGCSEAVGGYWDNFWHKID